MASTQKKILVFQGSKETVYLYDSNESNITLDLTELRQWIALQLATDVNNLSAVYPCYLGNFKKDGEDIDFFCTKKSLTFEKKPLKRTKTLPTNQTYIFSKTI